MSHDASILTTKDFTILEVMLERCGTREDPMAQLLARKVNSAQIVFRDDVPANVATLSTRVVFSANGKDQDTRIISHDRMTSPIGLYLPITTLRGLALLGLVEGQEIRFADQEGTEEMIRLDKVLYQPEAAGREKRLLDPSVAAPARKPALRLIRGAFYDKPEICAAGPDGLDDPHGPAAA